MATVSVWDGKYIQFRDSVQAGIDAADGLVQVWQGKDGWVPGYNMEYSSSFPLPSTPVAEITSLSPNTAVMNTGTKLVTIFGTGFRADDDVLLDGVPIVSTHVNATTKTFTLPASTTAKTVVVKIRDVVDRESLGSNFVWTATELLEEPEV